MLGQQSQYQPVSQPVSDTKNQEPAPPPYQGNPNNVPVPAAPGGPPVPAYAPPQQQQQYATHQQQPVVYPSGQIAPARIISDASQLPVNIVTQDTLSKISNSTCVICRTPYQVGDSLMTLQCGHSSHSHCMQQWLSRATSCPMCRAQTLDDGKHVAGSAHTRSGTWGKCNGCGRDFVRGKPHTAAYFRCSNCHGILPALKSSCTIQ